MPKKAFERAGLCPSAGSSSSIPLRWYRGRKDCHRGFRCPQPRGTGCCGRPSCQRPAKSRLRAEPCRGSSGRTLAGSFAVLGARGRGVSVGRGRGRLRLRPARSDSPLRAAGGVRGTKGQKRWEGERSEGGECEEQPPEL